MRDVENWGGLMRNLPNAIFHGYVVAWCCILHPLLSINLLE